MDPRRTDSELETEDDYYGPVSQKQREQPEEHTRLSIYLGNPTYVYNIFLYFYRSHKGLAVPSKLHLANIILALLHHSLVESC